MIVMRRTGPRTATIAAALVGLAMVGSACDTGTGPDAPLPASIEALTAPVAAVPEYRKRVRVRVLDAAGRGVANVSVRFAPSAELHGTVNDGAAAVARTTGTGDADVIWRLPPEPGEYALTARIVEGGPMPAGPEALAVEVRATVGSFSPALDGMLISLSDLIATSYAHMQAALPLNPNLSAEFQERLDLLARPDLDSDIVAARRFHEHPASSIDGRAIPVATVFPAASMEPGAGGMGLLIEHGLGVLESLLGPFPSEVVRVWYGFALGSRGGGGTLFMEDRETYDRRAGPLPYDAIVHHEMAHSYIGNESVTQLVELIVYNVTRTGSTDLEAWLHLRGWQGPQDTNENIHALLDIYQLIGYDAVRHALRALLPLHPPYGQPLCDACIQAFVDASPAAARDGVRAKAERVRF